MSSGNASHRRPLHNLRKERIDECEGQVNQTIDRERIRPSRRLCWIEALDESREALGEELGEDM